MSMNTIPEALDELRAGHVIIVVDDPDRENEGDMICAAEFATTENVNFMASMAKGLICMPMSQRSVPEAAAAADGHREHRQPRDGLHRFHRPRGHHHGHLRGRSAVYHRAQSAWTTTPSPATSAGPGHMFPLVAKPSGVLERNGHTEATVDLMRHGGPEAVRPVLRDHARGRHHDAHERAARAGAASTT